MNAIVYAILIPLIVTFIAPFFRPRAATIVSFIAFIIPFFVILWALLTDQTFELPLVNLGKPIGEFYLFADSITNAFGVTICLISAMVALYSLPYMKHRFEEMKDEIENWSHNQSKSEWSDFSSMYVIILRNSGCAANVTPRLAHITVNS